MSPFCWPARVYWEDTDGGGVVYYANYLKYLERARTEWLRARGFSQQTLAREAGIMFAVTSVTLEYRRPARLDDELIVSCEPRVRGAASIDFVQHVYRREAARTDTGDATAPAGSAAGLHGCGARDEPGELLCSGEVRIACLDARTFRPQRLPGFMREAMADQEQS